MKRFMLLLFMLTVVSVTSFANTTNDEQKPDAKFKVDYQMPMQSVVIDNDTIHLVCITAETDTGTAQNITNSDDLTKPQSFIVDEPKAPDLRSFYLNNKAFLNQDIKNKNGLKTDKLFRRTDHEY